MINKYGTYYDQIKKEYEAYHSGWKDVIIFWIGIGILVGVGFLIGKL